MRILHIGKYYPPVPGGMERFLGDLTEAQRVAGDDVRVLVHGQRGIEHPDDPDWLMRCPVWLKLIFAPISPLFPFWLAKAIREQQSDVLHIHMPNLSAFWALLLPSARRIPWVIHWHSDVVPTSHKLALRLAYPHYRILERALLEQAEAIVATSRPYLDASEPLRQWRHKCHVVPLGVDPIRLPDVTSIALSSLMPSTPAPPPGGEGGAVARERGGAQTDWINISTFPTWHPQGLRILAIGRLSYYKGFETLIEAVAQSDALQLMLVGEGEERPRLEKLLKRHGNPKRIRLLGQQDDALCQQLLASCDVFCLPSRERTEAFGIVLMEAMRYGKALVVGDIPGSGVNWVARAGENALAVPPENPAALMQALLRLERDPVERARLGQAGLARFRSEFNINRVVMALGKVYAGVLPDNATPVTLDRPLVVIPALNEADSIGAVIRQIQAVGIGDILVVDDQSTDGTGDLARQAGARVLRAPQALGAWGAMQTGIRYAVRHGYAGVITMDADGQHEPAHLPELLAAGANHDVVIGAYPERGSPLRKLAWSYFRVLTGFNFADLTSGFRYYNRAACETLAGEEATLLDYQDIGVLLLLHKAGFSIGEIPVTMQPRQSGISRVYSSWWTVSRYMAETTLLCLARWQRKRPAQG